MRYRTHCERRKLMWECLVEWLQNGSLLRWVKAEALVSRVALVSGEYLVNY